VVGTVLIDQLDLRIANLIICARPVFGGSGRGSIGATNGWFSKVVKRRINLMEDTAASKSAYARIAYFPAKRCRFYRRFRLNSRFARTQFGGRAF
jgi:hypothetical protein